MNFAQFFQDAEYQEYSIGSTIFNEGDPGKVMYVILEGRVDILFKGRLIGEIQAGEIIGELALIDTSARSATAIAMGQCKLVPVDEQLFLEMVKENPSFALAVMRTLANRLRRKNIRDF